MVLILLWETAVADEAGGPASAGRARLTAWVRGRGQGVRVQGVGFRWGVRSHALALGLHGWAENLPDGRVKVVAQGARGACQQLLERLEGDDTPGHVAQVTHRWDEPADGVV